MRTAEAALIELGAEVEARVGQIKSEIERSAYRIAQEIDGGDRTVIGVNKYVMDVEEPYEPLRVDPQIEIDQCAALEKLKSARDTAVVDAALDKVREAARGTDNLLYPMKDALQAGATGGEISQALRDVWGQYVPRETF